MSDEGLTIVVLGEGGAAARRFRLGRAKLWLLATAAVAAPLAILFAGYQLGARSGNAVARPAAAPADRPADRQEPADARPPDRSALVATTTVASTAPAAPSERPAAADQAHDAPASEAVLTIESAGEDAADLEVHPFDVNDEPRGDAFDKLEAAFACVGGERARPAPALVRVLLEAQEHFERPLAIRAGRCPAHTDRAEASSLHRSGQGVDVRMKGVSTGRLTSWFEEQKVGGVGRYRHRGFVHVDVRKGPPEHWEPEVRSARDSEKRPSQGKAKTRVEPEPQDSSPAATPEETDDDAPDNTKPSAGEAPQADVSTQTSEDPPAPAAQKPTAAPSDPDSLAVGAY